MRKLRDKLNKKGFTLVELIVVIVIVLILAAALVPNVMRYIDKARRSAFQAEAAAYMTEVQGYVTEDYAKKTHLITPATSSAVAWPTSYKLTKSMTGQIVSAVNMNIGTSEIQVVVKGASVEEFGYANKTYKVEWKKEKITSPDTDYPNKGWTDVKATGE